MSYITFDTSVIISRKLRIMPDNFLLSAPVLLELMRSASDDSSQKRLEAMYRAYQKDNSLIVPKEEDWLLSSKVLYWLTKGRKKRAGGKTPAVKKDSGQRMAFDVLIAISARRWNATVVTADYDDFKAIQYYCNFKVVKDSDFFK